MQDAGFQGTRLAEPPLPPGPPPGTVQREVGPLFVLLQAAAAPLRLRAWWAAPPPIPQPRSQAPVAARLFRPVTTIAAAATLYKW